MAVDNETVKFIKELPVSLETNSFAKTRSITERIIILLQKKDDTSTILLRILCKLLPTLLYHKNRKILSYMNNVIKEIVSLDCQYCCKNILSDLYEFALLKASYNVVRKVADSCSCALEWTSIFVTYGWNYLIENNNEYLRKIVLIQAKLYFCIITDAGRKNGYKTSGVLHNMWMKNCDIRNTYESILFELEQSQDIGLLGACYNSLIISYKLVPTEKSKSFQRKISEIFAKTVLSSKTAPDINLVKQFIQCLRFNEDDEFRSIIFPAINKAMLRNPENMLECVSHVISHIKNIDLNPYVLDIGKSFAANLCSKTDHLRDQATEGFNKLSSVCTEYHELELLLKYLFNVYHGSAGQLTLATQKISVLQGIGNLSKNKVPSVSNLQNSTEIVVCGIVKILDTEVNESIVTRAIEIMKLWFQKLSPTVTISDSSISSIQKKLSSKNTTPTVKKSYFICLKEYYTRTGSLGSSNLISILIESVEKAFSQSHSIPVVNEGLCATNLLFLFARNENCEKRIATTLEIVDAKKQIFFADKFLSQASVEILSNVVSLCCFILCKNLKNIEESQSRLLRALIYCSVASDANLREDAMKSIHELVVLSEKPVEMIVNFLKEFTEFLELVKLKRSNENEHLMNGEDCITGLNIYANEYLLSNTLRRICFSSEKLNKSEVDTVCFESLIPSHHPKIDNNNLWIDIVNSFQIKPTDLIRNNEKKLIKMLVENYDSSSRMENTLTTVINLQPETLLPSIMKNTIQFLDSKDLINIVKEEYEIFLTPENELYNKSILDTVTDKGSTDNTKNMKRENKLYSFKEQQEEIELRKELEEKKRKAGKVKEPELTEKQKEVIKAELEKESAIRNRIVQLQKRLKNIISMLRAAIKGNPLYLSIRFRSLIPSVLKNLPSILAASDLSDLFLQLRYCVFPKSSKNALFGTFIAYLILRYEKPNCKLDKEWIEEDINKASIRAVGILSSLELLPAPAFAYCFPFISSVILSAAADTDILQKCLHIITKYSNIRGKVQKKFNSPKLLPRQQMFELLIEVISSTGGGILQLAAANAFLNLGASCSNEDGCDACTTEEINSLLQGLLHVDPVVRGIVLKTLNVMSSGFPTAKKDFQVHLRITKRLWRCKFDILSDNRDLANAVWISSGLDNKMNGLADSLFEDIIYPVYDIQEAAALALAELIKEIPNNAQSITKKLLNIYHDKNVLIPAEVDILGHIVKPAVDHWESRRGIALALEQLAPHLSPEILTTLINFYVQTGIQDRNEVVANSMLKAGIALINKQDKELVTKFLTIFETFLKKTPSSSNFDTARAGVIVLMGTLACHLEPTDPKVKAILNKLIDSLSTPSQQVQEAIANCLPPLIALFKDDAPEIQKKLMNRLLNSNSYGERKGAAYGVAAVVKGVGIMYMKQLEVMTTLTNAIQDKKNYKHREGALFAFEKLSWILGRLFEPYIVHVLPHLLVCFGDNSQYVRTATDDCARVVMSKLSAHGVKLILPSLLSALDDESWRTKTGSVELLGSMAYCAPKQLSSCLPSIVPKLIEVLRDSHIKVQEAGAQALKVIGSVIRNPEIQAMVHILIEALQDPSNKIAPCLHALLDTKFIHFIDAPSLALIMPVIQRAFMDRSTETRKMAAQIIGNMYSLTDEKDLAPYLPAVMPGLRNSLLDSVPEIRAVSAKAMGAMVRGLGESSFADLLPWLMATLISENSAVDRQGAAQGLSEVVGGLGIDKLQKLMPDVIATAERYDIAPHVKDGYLMMFIYMPSVFGDDFIPYIGQIIVPILKALADETEYVRETALKAGQRIVSMYAESAIQLLLPELEKGIFDDNWRIRLSSVQLLGDLLYRISGVTGKMSTETAHEDDNFGTEHSHKVIINALGEERRNRVFSGLYICRSDVSLSVRQAALHVWKVVVTNTPRTLREILKTLFGLLLNCLASGNYDKRQVAARTLGDLVRKLGERILPEIIPLLEKGLESDNPQKRQGVCVGLSEIVGSTSKDMVMAFVNNLVPTIRKTLCDPLPAVRRAAAKTFDSFHNSVGSTALDQILPYMLEQLNNENDEICERALDGLREIMLIKSRVVLPYLIPTLTTPPINTKVLAVLAAAAGDTLTKYLHKILPTLLKIVATSEERCEMTYCQSVILAVTDEVGIGIIMDNLQEATRSESLNTRKAAICLLSSFCTQSKANYVNYVPQLLRIFIFLLSDSDNDVLQMSIEALGSIIKSQSGEQLMNLVPDIRVALKHAANEIKDSNKILPGLCLRKGIVTLVPVFREAMLGSGPSELKEQGATGFGEAIKLTSSECLKGSVVVVTGPLIRVLGERLVPSVKAAVIETLAILLDKVGIVLKQFLPQLQTTFLKSLSEPSQQVRLKSAYGLSRLVLIHGKAETLFVELNSLLKSAEDQVIKEVVLYTLRLIVIPVGDSMGEQLRRSLFIYLRDSLGCTEDSTRSAIAACLGCLARWLSPEQLNVLMLEHVLVDDANIDLSLRLGRSTVLFVALKEIPDHIYNDSFAERINKTIISHLSSEKIPLIMNGIRSCCYLLLHLMEKDKPLPPRVLSTFIRLLNHSHSDVKQFIPKVCMYLAGSTVKITPDFLKAVIPMLVNGTKENNTFLRANCELALIAVLKLREDEQSIEQECLNILEIGAKEALSEVIVKVLKKVTTRFSTKEEEIDNTLLS